MDNLRLGLFIGAGASVPFGKFTTKNFKAHLLMKRERETHKSNRTKCEDIELSLLASPVFKDIEQILQIYDELETISSFSIYNNLILNNETIFYNNELVKFGLLSDFINCVSYINSKIKEELFSHYKWYNRDDENLLIIYDEIFSTFKDVKKIVFTTNYDRSIERYCQLKNIELLDGFRLGKHYIQWENNFDIIENSQDAILLLKLHGSLNWKVTGTVIEKSGSYEEISKNNENKDVFIKPTLDKKILLNVIKYQPFIDIFNKFEEYLKKIDVLIFIGFSFRDEGIVKMIKDNLIDKGKSIISISPTSKIEIKENLINKSMIKREDEDVFILNTNSIIKMIEKEISNKNIHEIVKDLQYAINYIKNINIYQ